MGTITPSRTGASTDYFTLDIFVSNTYCSTESSAVTTVSNELKSIGYSAGLSYYYCEELTFGSSTGFRIIIFL